MRLLTPRLVLALCAALATAGSAAAAAPANDNCAGAESILVRRGQALFHDVNSYSASKSTELLCTADGNDDDVWFSFVAAEPGLIIEYRDLKGGDGGLGYALYDDCGGELLACDYGFGDGTRGFTFANLSEPLTQGATYYLAVFAEGDGGARFGVRVTGHEEPPIAANPGDDCVSVTVQLDGSGGTVDVLSPEGAVFLSLGNEENLGATNVTLRGHAGGDVRKEGGYNIYDRNVAVFPARQPTAPVQVSLYVTGDEFARLAETTTGGDDFQNYATAELQDGVCSGSYPGGGTEQELGAAFQYPGGYRFNLEVAAFSEFFIVSGSGVLPVELVDFSVAAHGSANEATWRVAEEVDLAGYRLERSASGRSAETWQTVTTVEARGTEAGGTLDYRVNDALPLPVAYYRLAQVDDDGTTAYSPTVVVTRESSSEQPLAIYPNPAAGVSNVTVATPGWSGALEVRLVDATGREVLRRSGEAGVSLGLPVAGVPAGLYTAEVRSGQRVEARRLIIR